MLKIFSKVIVMVALNTLLNRCADFWEFTQNRCIRKSARRESTLWNLSVPSQNLCRRPRLVAPSMMCSWYIYINTYIRTYVHVYIHVRACIYVFSHEHTMSKSMSNPVFRCTVKYVLVVYTYMYLWICIHIYININIHICIYIYIHMYIYIYINVRGWIYIWICVYICVCICVYMCVYMCLCV